MSQTNNRGLPRFSRRQVTKRTFNLLGSPNVLNNVQPGKKTRGSTQKRKISESEQNVVIDQRNNKSLSSRSTVDKGISASPVAFLKQQKENKSSRNLNVIDHVDRHKDGDEIEYTPQKYQKFDGTDYSPALGDVSVSFLASTPKPGRPQLSRRRPMSPVTEPLVRPQVTPDVITLEEMPENNFTDNYLFKQQKVPLLEDIEDRQHSPRKRSPLKQASIKGTPRKNSSPQKQIAGSTINEKIASINQSRLEKKRNNSELRNKTSLRETNSEEGKTRAGAKSASKQMNRSERTINAEKQQKMSVPVKKIPVSKSRPVEQNSSSSRDIEMSDLTETQTSLGNKSSKLKINKSKATSEANFSERQESRGNSSRTRIRNNVSSSETDESVQDDTSRGSLINKQRMSINRKLQQLGRKMEVSSKSADDMSAIDQTMMVWETEGQKRSRSDLIDLDVVLNSVTETLESRMDVYDTDEEQSAIRLVEKYLTRDITHMIQGAQTVTGLQNKIKKSTQSIKQKQKSLLALQKQRTELEDKCEPLKKARKDNENLTTINQFLNDLDQLIKEC